VRITLPDSLAIPIGSKNPDARTIAGALPRHRERGASPTTPSAFRQRDPPTVLPEHTAVGADKLSATIAYHEVSTAKTSGGSRTKSQTSGDAGSIAAKILA
jgi:hypothetical protein